MHAHHDSYRAAAKALLLSCSAPASRSHAITDNGMLCANRSFNAAPLPFKGRRRTRAAVVVSAFNTCVRDLHWIRQGVRKIIFLVIRTHRHVSSFDQQHDWPSAIAMRILACVRPPSFEQAVTGVRNP